MKKNILLILFIILLSVPIVSCKYSQNQNKKNITTDNVEIVEEKIEEPEKITNFEALGKTYTSSKDLSQIEVGTNIYDDQNSIHYTKGEYKELDFANDLLYLYLNENSSIYDFLVSYDSSTEKGYIPITESDKEKLIKNLNSLRDQMDLSDGEEMIVRLDRVTYEGHSSKTNTGSSFKIRVAISKVGASVVPWNYFTVTVFEEGNKLFAYLF